MIETAELAYSSEGLLNRVNFYSGYNDINLFVEDEKSQYLYETIFKRILGEHYSIKTIFPCGGKPKVIEAFQTYGSKANGIENIYLVDGDFDIFLFPDRMIHHSHFLYLHMYNIESCLINEIGLCGIVKSKLKCMDVEAYEKLNYIGWKTRIVSEAKELFLCYCYIQKYDSQTPNVNRSHYEFLDWKTGFKKQDDSFEEYKNSLIEKYPDFEEKIEEIKNIFERTNGKHYEKIICGKFLLSSLHDYLVQIVGCPIVKDDLLWEMAKTFDVSSFNYVREACVGLGAPS